MRGYSFGVGKPLPTYAFGAGFEEKNWSIPDTSRQINFWGQIDFRLTNFLTLRTIRGGRVEKLNKLVRNDFRPFDDRSARRHLFWFATLALWNEKPQE